MGLYNNYYFFCKSIPLSGIFIHLNLYNIMKRTIKTIFLALCYSGSYKWANFYPNTFTGHILGPHGTPTEKYCFYLGMGRSKHYGQISRKLDAQ